MRRAIEHLHLAPVMFELGARPHPPRSLYRAYLAQSHVFIGIYWQRYGWIAPGENISGLEDEYRLAGDRPRLLYIKAPAPDQEDRLESLLREFRTDDLASYKHFETTDELAELVRNDLALLLTERFEATAAPSSPQQAGRSAAPMPLTRTVGRGEEIDLVVANLRDGQRLITLTGPGGVGKTRIALESARASESDYSGGVHFVPLAAINDVSQVGRTIVDRLGVRTEGSWTPLDALADHFGDGPGLLVLDNLEQIEGAESWLRQLLERIPYLDVLATSRRAMRIAGEREITVPPLHLPDPSASQEELAEEPAVQLFAERARDANPAFTLDAATTRDVADICIRLDALPLAIELAAARSRLLPPAKLLRRLADGLDVLRSQASDLPQRQQTLRATLEWSHQLLKQPERLLLARLSVFAGSFSLEAAETVGGAHEQPPVIDALTGLLDNSLVLVADDPNLAEPRFRMLETVRSFALEQLARLGETSLLGARHLDWYRRLAHEAQPFLCGPNQRMWTARFDPERDNLRVAVATAFANHDLAAVVDLVWDLAVFYEIRDASDETRAWIQQVGERNPDFDDVMRAKLRSIDALLRVQVGDHTGARDALEWSLSVFQANDMSFHAAVTMMVLSDFYIATDGDVSHPVAVLEESIRMFQSVGHDWGVARTEIMLARVLWATGDDEGAERHLNLSLGHSRLIENEPQIARALSMLAMVGASRRPATQLTLWLHEAGEIVVRGRYRAEATFCLDALAGALADKGFAEAAQEAIAVSEALRHSLGLPSPHPVKQRASEISKSAGSSGHQQLSRAASLRQRDSVFDYISRILQDTLT